MDTALQHRLNEYDSKCELPSFSAIDRNTLRKSVKDHRHGLLSPLDGRVVSIVRIKERAMRTLIKKHQTSESDFVKLRDTFADDVILYSRTFYPHVEHSLARHPSVSRWRQMKAGPFLAWPLANAKEDFLNWRRPRADDVAAEAVMSVVDAQWLPYRTVMGAQQRAQAVGKAAKAAARRAAANSSTSSQSTVNEQSMILEQYEKDVNMDTDEVDMVENQPEDNVVGISNEHHLGTDLENVCEETTHPVLFANNAEVFSVSQVKKEVCSRAAQAMTKEHTVPEPPMGEPNEDEDIKEHQMGETINEDCQVKAEDGSSDVLVIPQKDISKKRRLREAAEDSKNIKKRKEGPIGRPTVKGIIVIGDVSSAVKDKPVMDKFYYFGSFVASNLREMSDDSSSKKIIKINHVLNEEECTLSQIKKEVYSRAALALIKDQTINEPHDGEDTKEQIKKHEERQNGRPFAEGIPTPGKVASDVKDKPATDKFEYIGAFVALSLRAMSPASSSDRTTRIFQVFNGAEE